MNMFAQEKDRSSAIESIDPSRWDYPRVLTRPDLKLLTVCIRVCLILAFAVTIIILLRYGVRQSLAISIGLSVLFCTLVVVFCAKQIVIWFVKFHQRYAPLHIRLKCRYEPSCSEYMILAIEKYGVMHGVIKGIRRILRCRPGNGGFDLP